jgi:tetratricopeptide (TPR) repeat protein/predicted aspartyl protease
MKRNGSHPEPPAAAPTRELGQRPAFLIAAIVATAATVVPSPTLAACQLGRIAELPVTMVGMKALVPAKINGADAQFVLDSGAFYSIITPAAATEFKLHLGPAPYNLQVRGIGGSAPASVATVDVFTIAGARLRDLQFVVAGGEVGAGAAGALGQNILRLADTEYDFANGVVRLWRPHNCGSDMLAYWAKSQPYSVVKIDWTTFGSPHIIGTGSLNGHNLRVVFDSGSARSMVTLRAAEQAGFNPAGPDVLSSGLLRGVGPQPAKAWVSTFSSFKLGDEEVRNARLTVADTRLFGVDMLLGADFFLSHRIYIAISQNKLYFTYNGGPIFNFSAPSRQPSAAPPASGTQAGLNAAQPGASGSQAGAPGAAGAAGMAGAEPTDAAGLARRGAAFAARRDFADAIADLTRACELDPGNPQYFYERGEARLGDRQPFLAMDDFSHTLQLDPRNLQALVSRAALRLAGHDDSGAVSDLDAAVRVAPTEADVRLRIGGLYIDAGRFEPAVAQFDLWIANHPDDSRKADALNDRCWARALWGRDLKKALRDCNLALRMRSGAGPLTARFLDSRALVEQRLGDFSPSIADYDAALRFYPKNAWLLYSRGVTELRAGRTAEGRADIASAVALQPNIEDVGRSRGVAP